MSLAVLVGLKLSDKKTAWVATFVKFGSSLRFAAATIAILALGATAVPRPARTGVDKRTPHRTVLHDGLSLNGQNQQPDNPQPFALKVSEPFESKIKGGETQVLTVTLHQGQYAQVAFEWRGMDLDVQVRRPNETGSKPPYFPVRSSGSLPISLIASAAGDYSLVVRPTENAKITGRYGVILEIVRPPEPVDQKRVEAQNLTGDAEKEQTRDAATEKLRQALQLWNEIGDQHGISQTLQLLGRKYLSSRTSTTNKPGENVETIGKEYYQSAIKVAEKGNRLQFAYTLLDIGSDHEKFISPEEALKSYEQALPIFRAKDIGNPRGEAAALFSIGIAHARMAQMNKALESYKPALDINRAENDRLEEARTLNAMGGAYQYLGDLALALQYYEQAAPIWLELNDLYRQALTIKNIGVVYDDLGDLQTARDKYQESLLLLELQLTTKDLDSCKGKILSQDTRLCNSIANTMDNVGEFYNTLGEPLLALSTFRDGLTIRENLNQPQGIGATLSRIAYAHLLQGDPTEALKYCKLAMRLSQETKDNRKIGSILTFIGMAKAALGQTDEALDYYRQAMMVWDKKAEDLRGKGITLDQMGRAYALKQDVERAIESYQSALSIWHLVRDREWEPRSLYNLASAERDRGNFTVAQQQLEKAIQIVESRRNTLSSLQLRTAYFANKEDIYKLDADLKMQLAKVLNDDRYAVSALETTDQARARTLVDVLSEANLSRELAESPNAPLDPRVAQLKAKKRLLQDQLNFKSQSQWHLLRGKHTQEQAEAINKEIGQLTNAYDTLTAQIAAINPRYAALVRPTRLTAVQIQKLLDDNTLLLEYALGDKRSYVWVVTPNSVKGFELPGREQVEAVARRVTGSLTARNRENPNESFTQTQVRLANAEREYAEASTALSKMIVGPVASLLNRKRLIVIADGALQMVPFGALPVPVNTALVNSASDESWKSRTTSLGPVASLQRTLINDYELISLPSASVLALQRRELANRKPAPLAVAVIADPVFDLDDARVAKSSDNGNQHRKAAAAPRQGRPSISKPSTQELTSVGQNAQSLPVPAGPILKESILARTLRDLGLGQDGKLRRLTYSLREAMAISRAATPNQSFTALGFKASRETATSLKLSQYRIVHFATHGVMDLEHPELSGIVLSMVDENGKPQDGYLRLLEIYNLDLPAELVVLSACQTGVGKQIKGEGLIALTRGFMNAGAKSVVASLWKVDDAATAALMAEFYKQMFTNKLKPAAALRQAQIDISKQKVWQSPYYWAGFFIQGEWN